MAQVNRRSRCRTEWWEQFHIPSVWAEIEFYHDQPSVAWWLPVHEALRYSTGYQSDLPEGVVAVWVDWDTES